MQNPGTLATFKAKIKQIPPVILVFTLMVVFFTASHPTFLTINNIVNTPASGIHPGHALHGRGVREDSGGDRPVGRRDHVIVRNDNGLGSGGYVGAGDRRSRRRGPGRLRFGNVERIAGEQSANALVHRHPGYAGHRLRNIARHEQRTFDFRTSRFA